MILTSKVFMGKDLTLYIYIYIYMYSFSPLLSPYRYRLIAGDLCQGTDISNELTRTELVHCTGHETDSGYIVTMGSVSTVNVLLIQLH